MCGYAPSKFTFLLPALHKLLRKAEGTEHVNYRAQSLQWSNRKRFFAEVLPSATGAVAGLAGNCRSN